jgi:hypothetical protein
MNKLSFPNISKSINKKVDIKKCISLRKLKQLAIDIGKYEIGGEYIEGCGFLVYPETTFYDNKQNRPYSKLYMRRGNVVFHTHPFILKQHNTFPSIEDLNTIISSKSMIGIIVCLKGIFKISAKREHNKNLKKLDKLDNLYQSLSLKNIESLYINKLISLDEYGLHYEFYNWKDSYELFV